MRVQVWGTSHEGHSVDSMWEDNTNIIPKQIGCNVRKTKTDSEHESKLPDKRRVRHEDPNTGPRAWYRATG